MKIVYSLSFALMLIQAKAQIGINTPNPLATFEVHKSALSTVPDGIIPPRISADSLKMKDHLYGAAQDGLFVHITSPVTKSSAKTENVSSPGYYIYDAGQTNRDKSKGQWKKMFSDPSVFTAKGKSGISLISSGKIFGGSEFKTIAFSGSLQKEIGSELTQGNQYLAQEAGLYAISYSVSLNDDAFGKMAGKTEIGIIKTSAENETQILDEIPFAKIYSAEGSQVFMSSKSAINHVYQLKSGDKLSFGILSEGKNKMISDFSTDIAVYKIR